MKQHITIEQLNELSKKGSDRLIEWWTPVRGDKYLKKDLNRELFYGQLDSPHDAEEAKPDKVYFCGTDGEGKERDLPLLSIGQMIEFLGDGRDYKHMPDMTIQFKEFSSESLVDYGIEFKYGNKTTKAYELCDVLWEAVKEDFR